MNTKSNIYFFDFDTITKVRDTITPVEEAFVDQYLNSLIFELDEEGELCCPFTPDTIKYLLVHAIRSFTNFTKDK